MSIVERPKKGIRSLVNGERMSQPEFHWRYEASREDEKWELIGGIVYMASPLKWKHSRYDLAMRVLPEYGGQSWTNADDYLEGAPELVAEIAHSRRALAMHAKRDDYRRNGVVEYLVLLVEEQQVRWFHFPDDEIRPNREGISRSRVFPGLWIDIEALLRRDSRRLMEVLQQGLASRPHASFIKRLEAAHRRHGSK